MPLQVVQKVLEVGRVPDGARGFAGVGVGGVVAEAVPVQQVRQKVELVHLLEGEREGEKWEPPPTQGQGGSYVVVLCTRRHFCD